MVIFHGKLSKIARGHNFTHIYHRQTHSSSSPFVNYQYKSIIIKHHQSSSIIIIFRDFPTASHILGSPKKTLSMLQVLTEAGAGLQHFGNLSAVA